MWVTQCGDGVVPLLIGDNEDDIGSFHGTAGEENRSVIANDSRPISQHGANRFARAASQPSGSLFEAKLRLFSSNVPLAIELIWKSTAGFDYFMALA
jgi:hypothetical protein